MKARHGQAPLLEVPLSASLADRRVHDRLSPLADVVDKEAPLHTYLGGSEADAGCGVHRLDHVLGKADEAPVDVVDLTGTLAQHRVTEHADVVRGHGAHSKGMRRLRVGRGRSHP